MKKYFFLWIGLISISGFAQKGLPKTDDNFSKYLNDGIKTDADADIKLSLTSLFAGFIELGYEHKLNQSWSATFTGGMAPFDIGEDFQSYEMTSSYNELNFTNTFRDGGYSFGIEGRRYTASSAITDFTFNSIKYRLRHSNFYAYQFTGNRNSVDKIYFDESSHELLLTRGRKKILGNSVSYEWSYGLGYRMLLTTKNTAFYPMYNFEFKVGYYIRY